MPNNKLFILCGIPFSGKTTLALKLSKYPNIIRIDLDDIKFRIFGDQIKDEHIDQPGWDKIYNQMYQEIKSGLKSGKSVVHDTGNFTLQERNLVRQIADKLGIKSLTIFVDTPKEVAYQRLLTNRKSGKRFNISDSAFESSCQEMEPPIGSEPNMIYDGVNCPDISIQSYLL